MQFSLYVSERPALPKFLLKSNSANNLCSALGVIDLVGFLCVSSNIQYNLPALSFLNIRGVRIFYYYCDNQSVDW